MRGNNSTLNWLSFYFILFFDKSNPAVRVTGLKAMHTGAPQSKYTFEELVSAGILRLESEFYHEIKSQEFCKIS